MQASGTPSGGVYFGWEIFDDQADPKDNDTSIAHWVSQPSCSGSPTCVARIKATKGGVVSIRVRYSASGGTAVSQIKKINFLQVSIDSIDFQGQAGTMTKDVLGAAAFLPILAPHWTAISPGVQGESKPVWYKTATKMKALVTFRISPQFSEPLTVTITGNGTTARPFISGTGPGAGESFTFKKAVTESQPQTITLPINTTLYLVTFESEALPGETRYYKPLTIDWVVDMGGLQVPLGPTKNETYVSLPPIGSSTDSRSLTAVHLGVSFDGAADADAAFYKVWEQFSPANSGPANVKNWNGDPLYYYQQGVDPGASALDLNGNPTIGATSAGELLHLQNGQCRTFVDLMMEALKVNGVRAQRIVTLDR